MAFSYACLTLQRVVLPIVLIIGALYRPVGISFVYLLMFFVSPFVPLATEKSTRATFSAYFIILIALTTILLLCHSLLQILILVMGIGDLFGTCTVTERLLRHIGFIGFQNLKALAIIEWLAPEVIVFVTALLVYIISKKLTKAPAIHVENGNSPPEVVPHANVVENLEENPNRVIVQESVESAGTTTDISSESDEDEEPNFDVLIKISPLFCLAALFFSAVLRPSVPGGVYFLTFLITGSYWATFKKLQRKFAILIRSVMAVIVAHTIFIVAYQTPWMQAHLDKQNLIARLIGLEPLATSTCSNDIRIFVYDTSYKADSFLNPIVLLLTYHVLSLTSKNLAKFQVTLRRDQQRPQIITEPTETTPLMHLAHHKPAPAATVDTNRIAGGTGPHTSNDIPLNSMHRNLRPNEEDDSGILDQIAYGIMGIAGFIYQNSYIFTNVLMMAWSIIYHSWLTFILLLWANALWMIPNQRKAMMRSSFFIVIYAELLLIAQYIYGMDLTNDELPAKINKTGINLAQIGFDRPQDHGVQPCVPLIVKTSFLLMFWVTLRQFFREKTHPRRRPSSIADIFAASSADDLADGAEDSKKTSKFLKKIGNIIKNLLVRLWIWLLILVIFLCAMTGEKMTGFRICYMALFLFFLLVFQSSSKAWVKLMYGFWLFLIFYAMSILILIYTYQFDKFDQYWTEYLNVAKTLQDDIGLERYKTKDLLLHFIPPTLIVILTVIQVHYFHSRFIASMSQAPTEGRASTASHTSARRAAIRYSRQLEFDIKDFTESAGELLYLFLKRLRSNTEKFLKAFKGVFWSLLELHWIKVVYITAFVCAVSEVSLLHVPFVVLCVFGTVSSVRMRVFFSRIISLVVTIIVLCKMIYQISYLDHSKYYSICTKDNILKLYGNNAEWFGLYKVDPEKGLIGLLQKYIIYMVVATLHAVITLRQYQMRRLRGTQNDPLPKVPFPNVNRESAERNLGNMIRYLLNYGFFKFGYEICLIALVSTISYRNDVVAVIYSAWLVTLLIFRRMRISHIWHVFQIFLVISLIVQYLLLVQVPPKMCLKYIWEDSPLSEPLQRWAMLPGRLKHDHTNKLIFDFVLLLLVNRLTRVYALEAVANFPGGSNQSVMKDIDNLGKVEFRNPTHDFLSQIRNYLDIFNHAILCGFYWVSLAVVFVAGTYIADFLALGYLIGAFIFLWEGSDFYLRPIKQIMRRWRILLVYNVSNIVLKTFLQMVGCLFMQELATNCCWLIHLLGINCAQTEPVNEEVISEDDCPPIRTQVVLLWDSICFAFLIFQLRIFQSHYFCHIITDTRANNILASRGADIIESLRQKKIEKRQEYEVDILHKIKRKMEKIRATQQKMLRPLEKPTHFDEHGNPVYSSRPHKRKEIKLHPHAVRAGDYYMFEEYDEKFELDLIMDPDIFDQDHENITHSDIKMNRRMTMYNEPSLKSKSQKDVPADGTEPSTSKRDDAKAQKSTVDSGARRESLPGADSEDEKHSSDEELEANPILRLIEGFLVTLTIRLNRLSRNYRKVNKILEEEKKTLKESSTLYMFYGGLRGRTAAAIYRLMKRNADSSDVNDDDATPQPPASSTSSKRNSATNAPPPSILSKPPPPLQQQQQKQQELQQVQQQQQQPSQINHNNTYESMQSQSHDPQSPPFNTTIPSPDPQQQQQQHSRGDINAIEPSSYDVADSTERRKESHTKAMLGVKGSEFIFDEDDFTSRDHNVFVEVLISAWYAILSNTDIICYIVVFMNQISEANLLTLPMPLMIFFWGTLSLPRPSKTFWITLMAYTQALVLIKCIFQFKLIWSNYHYNMFNNNPLGIDKLFGITMSNNYATMDLLLLLALFFHRYILKTHGLWKVDSYKPIMHGLEKEDDDEVSINDAAGGQDVNASEELPESASEERRKSGGYTSASNDEQEKISEAKKLVIRVGRIQRHKYWCGLLKFFQNLLYKPRLPADVYALMFLCDFINFFVLLFGFTAFSSKLSDGGVKTYLAENKVPVPFLIMLLVQFCLIVIDRALYLRKALKFKIAFHFMSIVGIHFWMFFIVPKVTGRSFYTSNPPIIFYFIKCFYLLLSSYQIKCGYPPRILGNFLTKSFSLINMIAFKVYMLVPFLYELRTILDWLCTDTTMTLFDWLKMEDIFASIFSIKCLRQLETDFPAIRATKKATLSKLILGGLIILLIVFLIWGPLTLFALFNTVGQSNVPTEAKLSLRIGSYEPIYVTTTRESTYVFNEQMFQQMLNVYKHEPEAKSFLLNYHASDIAAIRLSGSSPTLWNIAPPDKERLLNDLSGNSTLNIRLSYEITRTPPSKGQSGTVRSEVTFAMNGSFAYRETLFDMIAGSKTEGAVIIPHIVPKFVKVLNAGDAINVHALFIDRNSTFRGLSLKMNSSNDVAQWWEIADYCNNDENTILFKKLPLFNCSSGIVFYTFNDKKFPSTWTFITAGGIIGIYTTFVLVVSRFLKSFLGGQTRRIMYEDLPNVDRVLQLCLDIYLVREALEFILEEDLFAKLLFLYRSPETLIKWTRPPEDIGDDETDSESVRSRISGRRGEHAHQQPNP